MSNYQIKILIFYVRLIFSSKNLVSKKGGLKKGQLTGEEIVCNVIYFQTFL